MMLDMIPSRIASDVLAPQVFPRGRRPARRRVAVRSKHLTAISTPRRSGCFSVTVAEAVIAPGAGCCGSLNLHMGREEEALLSRGKIFAPGKSARRRARCADHQRLWDAARP